MNREDSLWGFLGMMCFSVFVLTACWYLITKLFFFPEYVLPTPTQVFDSFVEHKTSLLTDFIVTISESIAGFLLALSISFLIFLPIYFSKIVEKTFLPILISLKATPIIAIAPLLIIWLGYGYLGKVIMAAIVAFFPLVIGLMSGAKNIAREYITVFKSLRATSWQTLTMLSLPSAVPEVISACKVAATLSVVGAIVSELTGATKGIGHTIMIATYNIDTPLLFAGIILSSIAGIMMFTAVVILEKVLWRYRLGTAQPD